MSSFRPKHPLEVSCGSVSVVESRVIARRERVRALAAAIREKGHERVTSAGTMIAAFGVGVALEQISHRDAWWLVSLLGATSTLERLTLTAAAMVRRTGPTASS
jgi:hypothetical protein